MWVDNNSSHKWIIREPGQLEKWTIREDLLYMEIYWCTNTFRRAVYIVCILVIFRVFTYTGWSITSVLVVRFI